MTREGKENRLNADPDSFIALFGSSKIIIQSSFLLLLFLSPSLLHVINYFVLEHSKQKLNQTNTDVDKNPINLK